MIKKLVKLASVGILFLVLAGCQTATIIDLYHPETEKLEISEAVFTDEAYEPFRAGGVLFTPYTVQTQVGTGEEAYDKYALHLGVYKLNEFTESVVINHVKVTGTEDMNFSERNQELALPIEFSNDSIASSNVILLDEISADNMGLSDKSIIKIVLNVSVVENGETITKDLSYDFVTRLRTYQVQR